MNDNDLIEKVALLWIENGGDAEGIAWSWRRLQGRVSQLCIERTRAAIANATPDSPLPALPSPALEWDPPFTLEWDPHNKMATLRRRDGYTVVASMGERTYQRIKQAQNDGADFYELKGLFPLKHTVYNA